MLSQKAFIKQKQIPKFISSIILNDIKNSFIKSSKKEIFEGEQVIKYNRQLYLMYFNPIFIKQTPHYHIGNPLDLTDLRGNGGGERILYGITDTGLGLTTPSQNIVIKPNSIFNIHLPGSPPTIHQFYGPYCGSGGEGTAIFSYHKNKTKKYGEETMESYTMLYKKEFEPKPPELHECCGDNCPNCVWDLYFKDLEKYKKKKTEFII